VVRAITTLTLRRRGVETGPKVRHLRGRRWKARARMDCWGSGNLCWWWHYRRSTYGKAAVGLRAGTITAGRLVPDQRQVHWPTRRSSWNRRDGGGIPNAPRNDGQLPGSWTLNVNPERGERTNA